MRVTLPGRPAIRPEEGQRHQPEHVERGHERGEDREHPDELVGFECAEEDLVLAEEAGQRRNAGDGQRADGHRGKRNRQVPLQGAHAPHVLLPRHRMDDRAAAEEQQRLEEGMRHQMEHPNREGTHTDSREHVAKLRDRGVGQHALDVVLHQPDRRGQERREHADHRHNLQHHRRVGEQHGVPAEYVDAGRHHRRGMDEGGHGSRPLHRIGQPHEQRNLGALARGPDEQQQRNDRQHPEMAGLDRHGGCRALDAGEVERAERPKQQEDAEDESPVTDAVRDEGLLPGVARAWFLVPVADQQVRAETDTFPPDEHHQHVAAQHQQQHEEAEQVEVAEEPRHAAARLVVHVRGRVDVDQGADARHHQQHHRRQRIEPEAPRHLQRGARTVTRRRRHRRNPLRHDHVVTAHLGRQPEQLPERDERQSERRTHRGARYEPGRAPREHTDPHEPIDDGAESRQQWNRPDVLHHHFMRFISSMFTVSLFR